METVESLARHKRLVKDIVNEQVSCDDRAFKSASHLMRPKTYRAPRRSEQKLRHLLEIDTVNKTVTVEPLVTQEELVRALLPYGLIPQVVAEFKKISVGGAIMGASLESSSHRWGQLNDTALSYELLLSDGTVVEASRERHADLFYGVSGSYGSLARLLSAKLQLIRAAPYVTVQIYRFKSPQAFVEALKDFQEKEYLEGLIFAEDDCRWVVGTLSEKQALPLYTQAAYSAPWYHQKVYESQDPFQMPLYDYLFRYDRGAFWMGTYALFPSLLARFWLEDTPFFPPTFIKNDSAYNEPQYPSQLFRQLTGPFMDSATLYRWLHWRRESWFERHFVVQDFYLPLSQVAPFIHYSLASNGIRPLWICPCMATSTPQIFSPQQNDEILVCDIGVYGWPKSPLSSVEATQLLEKKCYALGGKKMFYSWNYLSEEKLWQLYPKGVYEALRNKYAAATFPSFVDKVLPR